MCGASKLELGVDELLEKGVKRVDLCDYHQLAWELLLRDHDPILVKEVTDRLKELKDSLRVKRNKMKEAEDACRMAGEISQTVLEPNDSFAFIEGPRVNVFPCLGVIKAAQDCPPTMCREIAELALDAEIYRVSLAEGAIDAENTLAELRLEEYAKRDVASLLCLAFLDFFRSLDEGQYEVELKSRVVLSWGTKL